MSGLSLAHLKTKFAKGILTYLLEDHLSTYLTDVGLDVASFVASLLTIYRQKGEEELRSNGKVSG